MLRLIRTMSDDNGAETANRQTELVDIRNTGAKSEKFGSRTQRRCPLATRNFVDGSSHATVLRHPRPAKRLQVASVSRARQAYPCQPERAPDGCLSDGCHERNRSSFLPASPMHNRH